MILNKPIDSDSFLNKYFWSNFIPDDCITKDGICGVNVKTRLPRFHSDLSNAETAEIIYNSIQRAFWDKCREIGRAFGYDDVEQSGRSGGWAIPLIEYRADDTIYFVKISVPYGNGSQNLSLRELILIERFNSFAAYVKHLHKLCLIEMEKITNLDQLDDLLEEIEEM